MIKTDLALEAKEMYDGKKADAINGIDAFTEEKDGLKITFVEVKNEDGEKAISKAKGKYVTIEMPQFEKIGNGYYNVCVNELKEQIKRLTENVESPKVLVAGLGNRKITPDAIGPLCVDNLIVTHHLHEMNISGISSLGDISALAPGVLGVTGVESAEIIKSLCDIINPHIVICVDALVAREINRLAKTIQITDTGISPGSGIGNTRSEISEKTMGVKVLAIGVPMVVEAATIAHDAVCEEFSEEMYKKIKTKVGDMIVSPKDSDSLVAVMSKIIASGINLAFHDIPLNDLYLYS